MSRSLFDRTRVKPPNNAGAIFIGKTNTPEFGLGSQTYNKVFGATRNAYNPDLTAGGSSGGAAVGLATHMLTTADGSDMMGSLRNPAAYNNVIGLVHAGWRGIEKGIVENSINKMISKGAHSNKIIAYIGPSIQKCCFEIGPDVSKKFPRNFQIFSNSDRSFLDLQELTNNILIKNSVLHKNIISSNECTKCNSDKFFSYRNTGSKSGRMIGVIGLT